MTTGSRQLFFVRMLLVLSVAAAIHRFAEGCLHLAAMPGADRWLGFYGYDDLRVYNLILVFSSVLITWGAVSLWRGNAKTGFGRYIAGKALLLAGEVYAVTDFATQSGRSFPWDTLFALLGIWIFFPLLILAHRKYWPHGRKLYSTG